MDYSYFPGCCVKGMNSPYGQSTLAVTIYNYWEVGAYETLAAVSILLLILLYAVSFLSRRFGGSEVRMD